MKLLGQSTFTAAWKRMAHTSQRVRKREKGWSRGGLIWGRRGIWGGHVGASSGREEGEGLVTGWPHLGEKGWSRGGLIWGRRGRRGGLEGNQNYWFFIIKFRNSYRFTLYKYEGLHKFT